MGALLFLTGATCLGIGLIRFVFRDWLTRSERVLWGTVIGWSVTTAFTYLLARISGHLTATIVWIAIGATWFGAGALWIPCLRKGITTTKGLRPTEISLLVLLCGFALLYVPLFSSHMLEPGADGALYSGGGSTPYDIPFHTALTTSFVYGDNFPPVYSPLPPAPLLYPYLPDFLTAALMASGSDLHTTLVVTAVPLTLGLTGIFFCFALRLSAIFFPATIDERLRSWIAAVATALFFCNGGFGFIYFLGNWRTGGLSPALDVNYTNNPALGLAWPNIVSDMLLPQRTSLFGLSMGLIVFSCFAIVWKEESDAGHQRNRHWTLLAFTGVLAGLLPWFHTHTYFAVGFVSVVLRLLRPRRIWLAFWIPAVLLAIPHLVGLLHHANGSGFTRLLPGWRGHDEPHWIVFWLRNFGLPGVLFIPAWFAASRRGRAFYIPFLALLLIALVVVVTPNDYDNLKLIYYWSAATAVIVAGWLVRMASVSLVRRTIVGVVVFASILSGALTLAYEFRTIKPVFSKEAVDTAGFVRRNTSPRSLFLTGSSLHNPVLSLAGRNVVRGPTAWLWSHGYPFVERDADVRAIYAGGPDAVDLLGYYQVDYVYIGPEEARELRANRDFFDRTFLVTYRNGEIAIYDSRRSERPKGSAYAPREYSSRVESDPAVWLTEFRRVVYGLYCYQRAALGRDPSYSESSTDLRLLGRDLYLGTPQWASVLEANERNLTDVWVQRPEFKERYDAMDAAGYVKTLHQNAGIECAGSHCSDLSTALGQGRETRATVLQHVAQEMRASGKDYKRSFVLAHYFAFFHRDADAAGLDFWQRDLEKTRDYLAISRAFLESTEYRDQRR
jgi:hypothetical protein